jgi:transposase
VLAPALSPGRVVVMDNLTVLKCSRVRELVQERGCELLYLPPYSPDSSPIEEAFSKARAVLKKACARTRSSLVEAIAAALSAVTPDDARGFVCHCGYVGYVTAAQSS